ncbi:MAG: phosphoglycerate dehydrogenase [Ignavibacteriales bacterium]|nr:phosphoglycerate dehydrogenase [Ignavibacteriales bacterium]
MMILITDEVDSQCVDILKAEGFNVEHRPGLTPEEIKRVLPQASALIVRSQTSVSADILEKGSLLKVIGRAGAGVDNIDVDAATRRGIIVMNTPGGNTISTAEHTISMMLSLARNIPQAHQSLKSGKWERKKFVGTELFGKTLGIIGLGKVGTEVARRCFSFEMKVIAFDPVLSSESAAKLGVELVDLHDIYRRADIITIHSPLMPETKGLLGKSAFSQCKLGVRIINCARGGIVDEQALYDALNEGKVAGAALDVFENEPPQGSPLLQHPRVIVTPHLGASTEEAQEKVAIQIAHQVADALQGRGIIGSVNADIIEHASRKELSPFLELGEKIGRFLAQIKEGELKTITISVSGKVLREYQKVLGSAVVKGIFEHLLYEPINYLNALPIAAERGITIVSLHEEEHDVYSNVLSVKYQTNKEERMLAGTVFGNRDVRIIGIDGFHFEFKPSGHFLIFSNIDRPGMLASVSTLLAKAQINIGGLSLGRYRSGERALTVVSIDSPLPPHVLAEIGSLDGILATKAVQV